VPGTPALNYERFDLENKAIDPRTGKPYAAPAVPDVNIDGEVLRSVPRKPRLLALPVPLRQDGHANWPTVLAAERRNHRLR